MAHLALSFGEYKDAAVASRIALSDWAAVVKEEEAHGASLRGPIMLGIFTLIVGVGGFFLWAGSTELSSAAIASGRVIVESSTKTVSHLEGGTLRALVVREGDKVKAGEVLARLDATRSESALLQLKQQQFADKAQLARLVAERNGSETFSYETQVPEWRRRPPATCSSRKGDCSLSEPAFSATRLRLTSRALRSSRASGWRSKRVADPGSSRKPW
jgi:multidrug efflux pump subunit AcrA (membrane-fusion protein)